MINEAVSERSISELMAQIGDVSVAFMAKNSYGNPETRIVGDQSHGLAEEYSTTEGEKAEYRKEVHEKVGIDKV